MKTFYLTTPIYYVNDKPHIGHAYTTILADVLTRFHRNLGEDVFFLTGLDEHGQKVQQAAEKHGVDPQKHCNEMAPRFLKLWENLHIQNDDFIRTTEKRHVDVVQHILQKVYDKGDIYEDEYEGLYSVSEERFITKKEADSGEFRDIKELKEKNYFFKIFFGLLFFILPPIFLAEPYLLVHLLAISGSLAHKNFSCFLDLNGTTPHTIHSSHPHHNL